MTQDREQYERDSELEKKLEFIKDVMSQFNDPSRIHGI
jgi:hypothetical protein